MIGFLVIIPTDGNAVDRDVLQRCASFLSVRGCSGITTGFSDGVGWAVCGSDRKFEGVIGDVRLDASDELVAAVGMAPATTDGGLLAVAYRKWGESFVNHIQGEFSFALFDRDNTKLIAVRDHFGTRPLFYAEIPSGLIVSNTLEAVLAHPDASNELNDSAIADFLLFDHIQDPTATSYRDVKRVPPAHRLIFERGTARVERYWEVPLIEQPIRRKSSEIIEEYLELLRKAVLDRTRDQKRVAVLMSGGLDSTTVAACAKEIGVEVAAFTLISGTHGPDPEEKYSRIAADRLGIQITHHHQESYEPFSGWERLPHRKPEPSMDLFPQSGDDFFEKIREYSPVALTGYGGDPGLFPSAEFVRRMARSSEVLALLSASAWYVVRHGKLPNVGLRTALRKSKEWKPSPLPKWLNPDFAADLDLKSRWREFHAKPAMKATLRPEAHAILSSPGWEQLFWFQDPSFMGVPVETRHPMFDLRVLRFLLTLPPIPWCVDKELLRRATKRKLPDEIRFRPKTSAGTAMPISRGLDLASLNEDIDPEFHRFVTYLPTGFLKSKEQSSWTNVRPLLLNLWLRHARFHTEIRR